MGLPEITDDAPRKRVSITPDPDLWEWFKAVAAIENRPIARQLDMLLEAERERRSVAERG